MDQRERIDDPETALRSALGGLQSGIWTALPAILQSFDATKVSCTAQIAVQRQVRSKDGVWSNQSLSVCTDCPVVFPRGGGYVLTFPLQKGDEGLLIVASRCIDSWWQQGGVQPQIEFRMHNLSDGFFLPGPFSQPSKPSAAVVASVAQLRSLDGKVFVEVASQKVRASPDGGTTLMTMTPGKIDATPDGGTTTVDLTAGKIKATPDGGATVLELDPALSSLTAGATSFKITPAGIAIVGNLSLNGNFTSTGSATGPGGVNIFQHRHGGVQTGGGISGEPIT